MKKILTTTFILLLASPALFSQEKWDLKKCVAYALENNIDIKQSRIQEKLSELTYKQSKDGRWPTLSFSTGFGEQFGRSIDPTTNQFTTNAISQASAGLQSGVTLFNFFSIKNNIDANRINLSAAEKQTEKLQNDIALNVAAAYLQALLTNEQANIAQVQLSQTSEQLNMTRKRVDAGDLPELNAVMLESQLATDSSNFLVTKSQYELNLLSLKALLNLPAEYPFAIATPNISEIPVVPIAELNPNDVYGSAANINPLLKVSQLKLEAAKKNTLVARGQMYPSLSAFGNLNSGYSSALKNYYTGTTSTVFLPSALYVDNNGTRLPVYSPSITYSEIQKASLPRQFNNNFQQSIGLSLSVPIFNGNQLRTNWNRAKQNERSMQLQTQADSLSLKQSIHQAYQNVISALQTKNSREKAVIAAQRSYDLGRKRYEIGMLPTLDLTVLQGNLQRAKIDAVTADFDYVFKLKVLEFYKENSIKL
ncbi:TolC family protein [Polluticaenibacter yanchengensis]|uniref:TolC family protein n=1 Tax=Polluticaenibacter yanchengensis TaxID=3014562 RepID=A0ABT4UMK5_9BACT|nr:TolC family protein [Chitinophagaceae bacterium LY-5]